MGDFLKGFRRPASGFFLLLSRPRLWPWAALPLAVAAVIYLVVYGCGFMALWSWQVPEVEWSFWGPVGGYLSAAVNYAGAFGLKFVIGVVALLFAYFTFTTVGLAIASPFNEWLTERVEAAVTGRPAEQPPAGMRAAASGLWHGVADGLLLAAGQLGAMVLTLPLLLVPLVGTFPLFAVGAWFAARNFLEVPTGRLYWRRDRKKALSRACARELFGYGVAMQILFMVPGIGLLALPVGVAGITLIYLEHARSVVVDNPPPFRAPATDRNA